MKDKYRLVWETHHLAVMAGLARRLIVRLFSAHGEGFQGTTSRSLHSVRFRWRPESSCWNQWIAHNCNGLDENNLLDSLSLDLVDPRQFPVCR